MRYAIVIEKAEGNYSAYVPDFLAALPPEQRLRRWRWRLARTRGSHRQYKHPSKPGTVTVAGKPSLDVPPGTLNAILKQADLKKEK
jgi:predicted RNA binding protein YcfA (HicA-like mRNA interferase family)